MFIPKFIAKWLAIFRGEVSPVLILLSVGSGFWFGVTPGFYGLHAALLMLVLILNTHIGLFLLAGALGKSLSLAAAPVLYHVGIFVQGALAPLLALLAAVPIVGITDFSRYAVAGAVVVGPIVGLILGAGLAKSVISYRNAWLKLEENSETFKRWHEKKWVRLLDRMLVGKSAKDVRQTLTKKPTIVRRAGVALALGLVVIAVIGAQFLTDERLTAYATESLTKLNGAQVDIERLSLQPFSGKVAAKGVQVTDPDNPQNNRISIDEFQTQASWYGLLTGKVVMDNLEISALKFDQPRAQPGAVLADTDEEDESSEGFDWGGFDLPDLDARTLESYFNNAQKIRETLAKIKPYLPERGEKTKPAPAGPPEEYLAYLRARASSLPTPRIIARRVVLDHVELPFEKLADSKIECLNINDAPAGARLPVTVKVTSNTSSDWLQIVNRYDAPEQGAEVTAEFSNIDLAALQGDLNSKNPVVFKGGTASAKIDGRAGRDMIDLGITVATDDMAVESVGGGALGLDPQITAEALKVIQDINTTVRLVGPLTQPKLVFDVPALREEFHAALIKAGKDQLAGRLGDVIGKELPVTQDIAKDLNPEKIGDVIGGLLGKDKPSDNNDEEEEKKDDKKLLDGLGGLLGGKKQSDNKDDDP